MSTLRSQLVVIAVLATTFSAAQSKDGNSLTIVYKDHHEQTVSSSDVSRIDLLHDVLIFNRNGREEKIPLSQISSINVRETKSTEASGRGHFVGKWKVGIDANTPASFEITLERDGKAHKNIDSRRGTWSFENGEARIAWDDGWHDVIAKVGNKFEKRAYAPGKPYTDPPTNVSAAKRDNDQSI